MSIRGTLFALFYDRQMARSERHGLHAMRMTLMSQAGGDVLEIGAGTGVNVGLYGPGVRSVVLTEPEPPLIKKLERKAAADSRVRVIRAPAEDLPFADAAFDTVVSTLVLCGVDDQPRAVHELHRVLRPGGRLLFIEHLRSAEPALARKQDRMNGLNRFIAGCECNRPTLDTLRLGGFTLIDVQHTELPKAPPFIRPLVVGAAAARAWVPSDSEAHSDSEARQ